MLRSSRCAAVDPRVIHRIAGDAGINGVTVLNNELYVLRDRTGNHVDIHSTTDFDLLRHVTIDGVTVDGLDDIAACPQNQCVYISDFGGRCVHRLGADGSAIRWRLIARPTGISVSSSTNILAVFTDEADEEAKVLEITGGNGNFVREITPDLDPGVKLDHCVQLDGDRYIVCHGKMQTSRVSQVNVDGTIVRSSDADAGLFLPWRMAVDDDWFVFVADARNNHIVLFDPSLKFVRHLSEGLTNRPIRLCFDGNTRRLYVAQSDKTVVVMQL